METTTTATAGLGCIQSARQEMEFGISEQPRCTAVGNVQNIELPMEKIIWLHTITVVNYHLSTLYVLKLLLEGRIGRANVAICTFSMRLPFL